MSFEPRAKKRFGQNFLKDRQVLDDIVAIISPKADDVMLEIGPGLGAMTQVLLPHLNHLDAIELDRDAIAYLIEHIKPIEKLTIHQGDVLAFNFAAFKPDEPLRVVGNLPYNISTPILFTLARMIDRLQDVHVMLQKEVAARICAKDGENNYGRLSVVLQYYFKVTYMLDVPPSAFKPEPKVDSAILRGVPRGKSERNARDEKHFEALVKQAFSMRRKTLRNNLKHFCDIKLIENAGIDPTLRPERVSVDEFVQLSNGIKAHEK
ncbi:MAG: 16S rRNA (adenine(1518)-N(6)/adenine(1519)-N(6))-dimethyltransferase [Gammaproteobacteria bacterium CG11_big_fil_rev_8_21_14_0_20_46_22]|nr:MAG: 16S rRNA (adenine(1518)-N(6)/adenine(1519)-N(6))-dimethyltransferase [Gammaproteobacteria bacterium CG12_big_fil_rev_8_21_14_0_65_46_12]PIR10952.1 MAG: 16S rRNA (adenine(1518)-N(6)/adenine(1519)-N(6))-dimethyltransferase [Gammaproteobacteria bacterium CG11_big_fil_rev_8_21_14_0_20_46_22]